MLRGLLPDKMRGLVMLAAVWMTFSPGYLSAASPMFYESEPLQQEIDRTKAIIDTLPATPGANPWTLGYASSWDDSPENPLTIEIQFSRPEVIDLVALLPAVYSDTGNVRQNFGFPLRFSLERLLPDGSAQMIANHLEEDYPDPGFGPQLFPCPDPVLTSGLRITVTRRALNPTWWKTSHVAALSELFAFAGERNVALRGNVTASSAFNLDGAWSPSYLTDGFSLYSPIDYQLSDPTKIFRAQGNEVRLEMDLGGERRIDEFRLWPVVYSVMHNYPPISGGGFPQSFRVELANAPDFSDAKVVFDDKQSGLIPGAGPWMQPISPTAGRFVRFTLKDGFRDIRHKDQLEINLGEIELLENGRVISGGLPVVAPGSQVQTKGLEMLTDGFISEGRILPLREWVTKFHQRIALTQLLKTSLWQAATDARVRDAKRTTAMLLIAVGVIVAMAQLVWLVRVTAHRRWARMRERIACDLHDEIGANVSSIAHTAELLKETIREPSNTQSRLLDNLIDSAHLTTRETKHFVRFIENEEQDRDLTEQFAQVSHRILGTIPVSFSLENTRSFNALDPSTKWNLLLFYKEALNNIIKHSSATAVEIHTRRTGSKLRLEVADNGRGLPERATSCRHLESRAKVLGGQLEILSRPTDGTRVILNFNRNSKS